MSNYSIPGMDMRATAGRGEREVPRPKLDESERKVQTTVTLDPQNLEWIKTNWRRLNYRSAAHAIDHAVSLLIEKRRHELGDT